MLKNTNSVKQRILFWMDCGVVFSFLFTWKDGLAKKLKTVLGSMDNKHFINRKPSIIVFNHGNILYYITNVKAYSITFENQR